MIENESEGKQRVKKTSGAQPGNQNARKHGWYSRQQLEEREDISQILKLLEDLNSKS